MPQTLTFMFTDVEGSTRLWERSPEAMAPALRRHEEILGAAITASEGRIVKTTGDGLMAVFASPVAAIAAGIAAQLGMIGEAWPEGCSIRVRVGLHTGEAEAREGDFFGPAVNRTARVMAAGHGGQILVSASTAALAAERLPSEVALRDLGEHRLKDLERPERLFQVRHPGLGTDFPPLLTLDLRPNNLPTQTSPFIGREAELELIRTRIADGDVRLLTLTGPGGTGKTRLALRAAAEAIDQFNDGVYFVDLSPATDTDAVVALVAGALGLGETRDASPLDELKRRLRPQRTLVVLDNFEQVAVAAPTFVELLQDAPGLKIVVTSREALRVRGENLVPVPPLSVPPSTGTAAELSQFEAIQLFVERARAVQPAFHLTDENAAAVAEICRRLDGLPLAIELATARINLFSPGELRDRLANRLKLLRGGPRDLPARQRTLQATIDWSYELLDPAERRLFEVLSVFSSAGLEAVEAVTGELEPMVGSDIDAIDGLGSLVDKSLVRRADVVEGSSTLRVFMLETIREYAAERLDADSAFADDVRQSHGRYFAELAARVSTGEGRGARDPGRSDLSADLDNLRIAWHFWVVHRDLDRLNQLVDSLWEIFEARGWYHATIGLIGDLLDVLATVPSSPERLEQELTLRMSLARALTLLRGYTGEVEDAYAQALALLEDHRELPQHFPILRGLASLYGFRGEFDKGIDVAREMLRLADEQADPSMRVDGTMILGAYTAFTGDLGAGLRHLDEAIELFESSGYRPRRLRLGNDPRVACLTTSGFFLWLLGRPDQGIERAGRAVELATELDHPYSLAYALYHSGFGHLWRREPRAMRERALALLRVAEENDFPVWRALGTCLLGAATSGLGEPEDGLALIGAGLDQYQGLRTPPVFWPFIRFLEAGAQLEAHQPDVGLTLIDEAIALGGPDEVVAPLFFVMRGDLQLLLADPGASEARASYRVAYDLADRFGARGPQLRAAVRLCRTAPAATRAEQRAVLRAMFERFDEGLSTPDLTEAAQLLSDE